MKKILFMNDYLFTGPYEEKARQLTGKFDNESGTCIFSSAIELYIASAIVGCYFNKTAEIIKSESHFKILTQQFTSRYDELIHIYQLVMLNANKDIDQTIDRINRAFKYYDSEENIILFERYMLGGLCIIYDSFIVSSNKRYDDYLTSLCSFINKFSKKETKNISEEIDFSEDLI